MALPAPSAAGLLPCCLQPYDCCWAGACTRQQCDMCQSLLLPAALYLLLGGPMLPPNKGWAVFLLWICAHAGGYIAARVNLPPLLGMLVAGIILQNIPQGELWLQLCETPLRSMANSLLKPGSSVLNTPCPAMTFVLHWAYHQTLPSLMGQRSTIQWS